MWKLSFWFRVKSGSWIKTYSNALIVITLQITSQIWSSMWKIVTFSKRVMFVNIVWKSARLEMPYQHTYPGSTGILNKACLISVKHSDESIAVAINEKIIKVSSNEFRCVDCEHSCKTKQNMQKHIEAKHFVNCEISCQFCGHISPNRWAYGTHLNRHHKSRVWLIHFEGIIALFSKVSQSFIMQRNLLKSLTIQLKLCSTRLSQDFSVPSVNMWANKNRTW